MASLVSFEYEEKGVRSAGDGKWYPLVTMEWVEGETLYTYVRTQCLHGHGKAIVRLADHWIELVRELAALQIAHGDLQHGNVMVANTGRMKLVDYDCMCVPLLEGRKNLEVGVDPYQHPSRDENTLLDRNLDNFSALFILVALKALAAAPDLWNQYVEQTGYEKLLLRREDLHEPAKSPLMQAILRSPDNSVRRLSKTLLELVRVDLHEVPRLDDVLFSWPPVELLLDQRDFDAAMELILRAEAGCRRPGPAAIAAAQRRGADPMPALAGAGGPVGRRVRDGEVLPAAAFGRLSPCGVRRRDRSPRRSDRSGSGAAPERLPREALAAIRRGMGAGGGDSRRPEERRALRGVGPAVEGPLSGVGYRQGALVSLGLGSRGRRTLLANCPGDTRGGVLPRRS